jgi:hypothetical protein
MPKQVRLDGEPATAQAPFSSKLRGDQILISFSTKALANDFSKMDFHSRVLHSLKPDSNNMWREGSRLDVEIRGWPKLIRWVRISDNEFRGSISTHSEDMLRDYAGTLSQVLSDILIGTKDAAGRPVYRFSIGNANQWTPYSFYSKARTIAALCVLYDLGPHPRNDLELNVPDTLGAQFFKLLT